MSGIWDWGSDAYGEQTEADGADELAKGDGRRHVCFALELWWGLGARGCWVFVAETGLTTWTISVVSRTLRSEYRVGHVRTVEVWNLSVLMSQVSDDARAALR